MPICSKCKQPKDSHLFSVDKATKSGLRPTCKECTNAATRALYREKVDHVAHLARVKKWRDQNKDRVKELEKSAHQRNKAKRNAYSIEYRKANREKTQALCRKWAYDNAEKMRATCAKRRAQKANAIPSWAGDEFDRFFMQESVRLAQLRSSVTGFQWHVDHKVPLRSHLVCGLHCAANIEVIPAVENHVKGNRVWPDMW